MNPWKREKLEAVQDLLATTRTFDQTKWTHTRRGCDTPACVAGHAALIGGYDLSVMGYEQIACKAADFLELTDDQGDALFTGAPYGIDEETSPVTQVEAILALQHLIDHDEVVWPERNPKDD